MIASQRINSSVQLISGSLRSGCVDGRITTSISAVKNSLSLCIWLDIPRPGWRLSRTSRATEKFIPGRTTRVKLAKRPFLDSSFMEAQGIRNVTSSREPLLHFSLLLFQRDLLLESRDLQCYSQCCCDPRIKSLENVGRTILKRLRYLQIVA